MRAGHVTPRILMRLLPHLNQNIILSLHFGDGNQVAVNRPAVERDFFNAFLDPRAIHHPDGERLVPEPAGGGKFLPAGRDAGIDEKAVVIGADAEEILRRRIIRPGCGAGQPGDARCAITRAVNAVSVLRVNVWLAAVFRPCR